jgi:hypothetical protein
MVLRRLNMSKKFDFPTVNLDELNGSERIKRYFHCAKCMEERPDGVSPREYGNYEVGLTDFGLEVWCKRHDEEVIYINLTDVWDLINTLKGVRGDPEMPLIEVPDFDRSDTLIYTGVSGVYIDPDKYWKNSDGRPPKNVLLDVFKRDRSEAA